MTSSKQDMGVTVRIEPATAQRLMDWNVLHITDEGWTIDLDIWAKRPAAVAPADDGQQNFAPPPLGFEAILDDEGNDTGYRREIATGAIVTFDEGDEP